MPSLMESIVKLDVGAQEPWPNDVKLYQPYAMEQILLPDNANCLAVQAFLHMCGLPFQIEHRANAEFMSPSGKVPFIKCGAFVVSELEPIVQFVANKGITLTEDLTADQKSDMRAYMSIIYTVLMNAELYICWCDKRTYNEVTKVRNGSVYPWPLNHFQTWSKRSAVNRKLKVLGWYQKTLESVYQEVENCCQALSERLDGKEYFFGSKPTQVDAFLYGHIFAILSSPEYSSELISILMKFPNLVSHCKRICTNYVCNTSLNFSELLEPMKSASKLIMDNNTCTYELKATNQVTAITRYLKFLNSESDLSELTHSSASRESCNSNSETVIQRFSLADDSEFDIQQLAEEKPTETNGKYQSLSKDDHDYLTNLFCANKPQQSEVKFMKLKSKEFSDNSSEDYSREDIPVFRASLKNVNKNISNSSMPFKKSGILKKSSETSSPISIEDNNSFDTYSSNLETEVEDERSNIENEELETKVSKDSLNIINVNNKISNMSSFSDDSLKQLKGVCFDSKNISKDSFSIADENLEKKVSKKSLLIVHENKVISDTSVLTDDSNKLGKRVSFADNISKNSFSIASDIENIASKKSLIIGNESNKVSCASFSREISDKKWKKNSIKSLPIVQKDKNNSGTFLSNIECAKSENLVSFNALMNTNQEKKYLDTSISSAKSGKNVSKTFLPISNENKKSSNALLFRQESGKLAEKVSKISVSNVNEYEKYLDTSISSEESLRKISKIPLFNINEYEIFLDTSMSGEESLKQVSKKPSPISNENKNSSTALLVRQEPEQQVKKNSKISLFNINEDEKYLDTSIPLEESGKQVSKNYLSILNENKNSSNALLLRQESENQVVSKISVNVNEDEKYLDTSISSEESLKQISKKPLLISNENKNISNSLLLKQGPEKQVSKDEKYLDTSISNQESLKQIFKQPLPISNENKNSSYALLLRQESGKQEKKVSKMSIFNVNEDEKYLDTSISSEESLKQIFKQPLSITNENSSNAFLLRQESGKQEKTNSKMSVFNVNKDEKYLDTSISSEESFKQIFKKPLPISNENITSSNSLLLRQESEKQVRNVSKISVNKDKKYLDFSVFSEKSGKQISKQHLPISNENKNSSNSLLLLRQKSEKEIKNVSKISLSNVNEDKKYLDFSTFCEKSGKQVSKQHLPISNETKNSSNSLLLRQKSEKQVKNVSKMSLCNVNEEEKYLDISASNDESGKQVSKKSLPISNEYKNSSNALLSRQQSEKRIKKVSKISVSNVSEHKKYLDTLTSNEKYGKQVSKKPLPISNVNKNSSNALWWRQGSEQQVKKVSKISVSNVKGDEKYLDTSASSEKSGKQVSEKPLPISNEYKNSSNASLSRPQSEKQIRKDSKISISNVNEEEKYLDITTSSAESEKQVSKKSLPISNENKNSSITSLFRQQSEKQIKKVSQISVSHVSEEEKYLDISTSSEESGEIVSKKSSPISNEDRKHSDTSIVSHESEKQTNKVSGTSLAIVYKDDKSLDISVSNEETGKKVSRNSLISPVSSKQGKRISKKSLNSDLTSEDEKFVDACTFSDDISQKSISSANEDSNASTTSSISAESSNTQQKIVSIISSFESNNKNNDISDTSFSSD